MSRTYFLQILLNFFILYGFVQLPLYLPPLASFGLWVLLKQQTMLIKAIQAHRRNTSTMTSALSYEPAIARN